MFVTPILADTLQDVKDFDQHFLFHLSSIFSTVIGAVGGATASSRVRMDLFGIIVCGTIASLGGGTVRDILLGGLINQQGVPVTVYWLGSDVEYLYQAIGTCIFMYFATKFYKPPVGTIRVADAFGLAFFTTLGAAKAYYLGCHGIVCICMGVCTGVAGGALRDLLTGNVPFVVRAREVYASACFVGSLALVVMLDMGVPYQIAYILGTVIVFTVRMVAVMLNWQLPSYRPLFDNVHNPLDDSHK